MKKIFGFIKGSLRFAIMMIILVTVLIVGCVFIKEHLWLSPKPKEAVTGLEDILR